MPNLNDPLLASHKKSFNEWLEKKEKGKTSYTINKKQYDEIKTILSLKEPKSHKFPTPQAKSNFFNQGWKLIDGHLYRECKYSSGGKKKKVDLRVVYKEIAYETIYQVHTTKVHLGNY